MDNLKHSDSEPGGNQLTSSLEAPLSSIIYPLNLGRSFSGAADRRSPPKREAGVTRDSQHAGRNVFWIAYSLGVIGLLAAVVYVLLT